MNEKLFFSEKLMLKSSQSAFFNLPKKQSILSEYLEEEKRVINSVIKVVNEEFKKITS